MKRRTLFQTLPVALLPPTAWASLLPQPPEAAEKSGPGGQSGAGQAATTVYELRIYHAVEGKLDDLLKRFKEHTMGLFERHGIKNVAY